LSGQNAGKFRQPTIRIAPAEQLAYLIRRANGTNSARPCAQHFEAKRVKPFKQTLQRLIEHPTLFVCYAGSRALTHFGVARPTFEGSSGNEAPGYMGIPCFAQSGKLGRA
jgi:hypothetical protein